MSGKRKRRSRAAVAWLAFLIASPCAGADTQTFTYSGDSMNTVLAEGNQQALLSGHARVTTEDLRITADQILLFGKDFVYAQATGNVHVVDSKRGLDLTSDRLFYDRDRKIARVTGNAIMADVKNELVVKGGFIEDRDTDKLTLVQIGVRILKKDLVCRAEFAKYWRDKKLVELSGLPWVSRRSDVYQAERITINLDTEEISLEGEVQGTIQSEKKEQPQAKSGEGPGQQTAPAPGSTAAPQPASTPPPTSQPPSSSPPSQGPGGTGASGG